MNAMTNRHAAGTLLAACGLLIGSGCSESRPSPDSATRDLAHHERAVQPDLAWTFDHGASDRDAMKSLDGGKKLDLAKTPDLKPADLARAPDHSKADQGKCSCTTNCPYQTTEQVCSGGGCVLPPGTRYASTDTFPIVPCTPGLGCMGTDTKIQVPAPVAISSVNVYLELAINSGDLLQVRLDSPGGQHIMLLSSFSTPVGYCGIMGSVVGAFPMSLTPEDSLGGLIGTSAQGTWTLHLYHSGGSGYVALKRWALYIG